MANQDTRKSDLAQAEILWKSADALRGRIDWERLTKAIRMRLRSVCGGM